MAEGMNYNCDFSNGLGSPHAIELLLWYHTHCDPHPRAHLELVVTETRVLASMGAIEKGDDDFYTTTDMGKAWVKALERCPPPTHAWLDNRGKVL